MDCCSGSVTSAFLWSPSPGRRSIPVNGHNLTSTEAIEAAADASLVVPINLGPTAVIVGTISGH